MVDVTGSIHPAQWQPAPPETAYRLQLTACGCATGMMRFCALRRTRARRKLTAQVSILNRLSNTMTAELDYL